MKAQAFDHICIAVRDLAQARAQYEDLLGLTLDGIHYGPTEAKAWAKKVAKDFISYATEGQGIGRRAIAVKDAKTDDDSTDRVEPLTMKPVSVKIRLIAKSTIEDLSKVTYKRALGISEYEVLKVESGTYPYKTLRLAVLLVENRKIQKRVVNRKIGTVRHLTLVPLSKYQSLERLETVDELEVNFGLPIMITNLD